MNYQNKCTVFTTPETLMTILPRQKLSINKKIDFSAKSDIMTTSNEQDNTFDAYDDDILVEDETIDYTEGIVQPTIHEPSYTSYATSNGNDTSSFPQQTVFNQKKSQEKDYQEMLIVRQALDFDERAFRDSYIRTESEIILKMRKDIDALYDWLDRLVADLTKSLNTFQETKKTSIEEKLRAIRENSIRADAINRSIQNFLTSIQHAYQHTFAPFLDHEK